MTKKKLNALKVPIKFAQTAKLFLKENNLLQTGFEQFAKNGFFYLPLVSNSISLNIPFEHKITSTSFQITDKQKAQSLKNLLSKKFSPQNLSLLHSSYDLIGDIAIVSIPPKLKSKSKTIANSLIKSNSRVKVVVQKSKFEGQFRIRGIKVLAGENRTTAIHKENGCVFYLDLNKVYFSSRLSFERNRICQLVKNDENVMVIFAGVGPFAIEIAKHLKSLKQRCQVLAIEWNPDACNYLLKNIKANKVEEFVQVHSVDANIFLKDKKYFKWADRVIMPLLHQSLDFIPVALNVCKKNSIIHAYAVIDGHDESGLVKTSNEIVKIGLKNKRNLKVISSRYCGAYSAKTNQASFDILVLD